MPLNADVIDDILAATYASASWKACQMEGTSWAGTGEENIKKYVSSIGVQSHSPSLPLSEVWLLIRGGLFEVLLCPFVPRSLTFHNFQILDEY